MEEQMPNQLQEIPQQETISNVPNQGANTNTNTNKHGDGFLVSLLSVLLLVAVLIAVFFAYQTQRLVMELNKTRTEQSKSESGETDDFKGWKTFIDNQGRFTFNYPPDYQVNQNGVISPISSGQSKDLTVQESDLKIEVISEDYDGDFSVESCFLDHSPEASTSAKSNITIGNTKYETILWDGLGTGEFTCIKNGNQRYLINKYPAKSERDSEYQRIMSTFRFIEPTACTLDAKMCPDGSYVGRIGPNCEFAACP